MKKILALLALAGVLSAGTVDWGTIPDDGITELRMAETTVFVYERRDLTLKAQNPQADYAGLQRQICSLYSNKMEIARNPYVFMYVYKDGYIMNRIDSCN